MARNPFDDVNNMFSQMNNMNLNELFESMIDTNLDAMYQQMGKIISDREKVRKNRPSISPYSILGIQENASEKEVKEAYRQKAREHHPDRGGDPNKFKIIQMAYELIKRQHGWS